VVSIAVACAFAYTALSLSLPIIVQHVIDDAIVPDDHSRLTELLGLLLVITVLRAGVSFCRRYATSIVGVRVEARMRALLYDGYLRFPRAFYDRQTTGQVVSRATNDLYPIRYFVGWGSVQTIQSAITIVAATALLLWVDPVLTVAAGLCMPLIVWLAWRFASGVTPISRVIRQRQADVTESAEESVVGIEMVQAFGREDTVRERFDGRASLVRDGFVDAAHVEARYLPAMFLMPLWAIGLVLLVGGLRVIDGHLTIGEFVLFQTVLLQLAWPLEALGWIIDLGQRAIASAGRSFAWLDGVRSLEDPAEPQGLPDGPLGLRFADVAFAYPGATDVLQEVELELAPGEVVALAGPTASGKSSLLGLVPRFYDPTAGALLLGGVDARALRVAELRGAVAIVTQRPVLFSATLRENLTLARPDAPWDEVLAACEAAGVADFVDDLPRGYDTAIGERGVNLSGGQRQRVALARALVSDARMLVLDDPLSAVDTVTERALVERLRPALEGRTVLVAAQRLSTLALADRVAVLVDGRVVEQGTTEDLLAAGGAFAALFGEEAALV
jgi:ABC-type multidrug transport system fused ATPase/permease subunit